MANPVLVSVLLPLLGACTTFAIASAPVGTIPPITTTIPSLPSDQSGLYLSERAEAEAYAFQGLPTPVAFSCINPALKPVLVLELPADMRLHGGMRGLTFATPEETVRDGQPYKRHRITLANPGQMWCRILWSSDIVEEGARSAYFWGEWGTESKQPEQTFALHVLEAPDVTPPKQMPTYLSIPSDLAEIWLKSGADPTRLGINRFDIWPYTRNNDASGIRSVNNILAMAEPLGLEISAWSGDWWFKDAKTDPEAATVGLDGVAGTYGCPTYRGKYYEELIAQGRLLIDLGIRRHVFDPEYYSGSLSPERICYCSRCRSQFSTFVRDRYPGLPAGDPIQFMREERPDARLRAAWFEFRAASYAGMFSGYREAMKAHIASNHTENASFEMLVINAYHRYRASYYGFENYRDSPLYTDSLEDPGMLQQSFEEFSPMIYPDIYADYGPYDMLLPWKDTLSLRKLAPHSDVAPLLTGGYPYASSYNCDFPTSAMKAQILEAAAGGARGFGIWGVCPTDAGDLREIAKAAALLAAAEPILIDGAPTDAFRDIQGQTFVKGVANAKEAVVLVSEYSTLPKTARVRYDGMQVPMSVTDLANGQLLGTITPAVPEFTVELTTDRTRLFRISPCGVGTPYQESQEIRWGHGWYSQSSGDYMMTATKWRLAHTVVPVEDMAVSQVAVRGSKSRVGAPCYYIGIQEDDGTTNHFPNGQWIGGPGNFATSAIPLNAWQVVPLPAMAQMVKGSRYHLVIEAGMANPTNYSSVIFNNQPLRTRYRILDGIYEDAVGCEENKGGAWVRSGSMPIFAIDTNANQAIGQPWSSGENAFTPTANVRFGQTFSLDIDTESPTVELLSFSLRLIAINKTPNDDLRVHLVPVGSSVPLLSMVLVDKTQLPAVGMITVATPPTRLRKGGNYQIIVESTNTNTSVGYYRLYSVHGPLDTEVAQAAQATFQGDSASCLTSNNNGAWIVKKSNGGSATDLIFEMQFRVPDMKGILILR